MSIVYDNQQALARRVARLLSGAVPSQDPPSRTVHQVSNLTVTTDEIDMIVAEAVVVVYEKRPSTPLAVLPTRTSWRLLPCQYDRGWRIVQKRVDLLDVDQYFENLTFLLCAPWNESKSAISSGPR